MDAPLPTSGRVRRLSTPALRARVLKEFRRTGRVDLATAYAGVDRTTHYNWLKQDDEYRRLFEEATIEATGLLEDEAFRRAYMGTMKPISVGGKVVMVTEFSDRLIEFLLEARNRRKYGKQQSLEVTGKDGTPLIPIGAIDSLLHGSTADDNE